jgi:Transposase DDE domain/zinc-finger of transposase IS204/IS1001/IS1096/IS1165
VGDDVGCQNVGLQDRELYRQILGIEAPWFVERVELKLAAGEVHIYLEHGEMASWPCPECEASCQLYDHQGERERRHLDTCQYETILHARPPHTQCAEHGVRVVKLRWAEPSSRFTALMERLVIDWLRAASQKAQPQRKKVEALFAELKNQIGLRRLRLRRLRSVREQFFLAAVAQNLKRLVRFLNQPKTPVIPATT